MPDRPKGVWRRAAPPVHVLHAALLRPFCAACGAHARGPSPLTALAQDIPDKSKRVVREAYLCWWFLLGALSYQFFCGSVMLGYSAAGSQKVPSWFLTSERLRLNSCGAGALWACRLTLRDHATNTLGTCWRMPAARSHLLAGGRAGLHLPLVQAPVLGGGQRLDLQLLDVLLLVLPALGLLRVVRDW